MQDLIKAVRALTADAEMRAALDEREIEFLWAAPGQIYGQHGWRPNNGSKSERTPYPVGNFKMAVRHGTEGNARDVLARRKKWLNSITVGQREADALENDAANAGGPQIRQWFLCACPTLKNIGKRGLAARLAVERCAWACASATQRPRYQHGRRRRLARRAWRRTRTSDEGGRRECWRKRSSLGKHRRRIDSPAVGAPNATRPRPDRTGV